MNLTEQEIEEFEERFSKRYIMKKRVNALICFIIAICGTTAMVSVPTGFNASYSIASIFVLYTSYEEAK